MNHKGFWFFFRYIIVRLFLLLHIVLQRLLLSNIFLFNIHFLHWAFVQLKRLTVFWLILIFYLINLMLFTDLGWSWPLNRFIYFLNWLDWSILLNFINQVNSLFFTIAFVDNLLIHFLWHTSWFNFWFFTPYLVNNSGVWFFWFHFLLFTFNITLQIVWFNRFLNLSLARLKIIYWLLGFTLFNSIFMSQDLMNRLFTFRFYIILGFYFQILLLLCLWLNLWFYTLLFLFIWKFLYLLIIQCLLLLWLRKFMWFNRLSIILTNNTFFIA